MAAGSHERFSSFMMRPLITWLSVMPPMRETSHRLEKNAGSRRAACPRLDIDPVATTASSPGLAAAASARKRAASLGSSSGAPAPRWTGMSRSHSRSIRAVLSCTTSIELLPNAVHAASTRTPSVPNRNSSAKPSSMSQPRTPIVLSKSMMILLSISSPGLHATEPLRTRRMRVSRRHARRPARSIGGPIGR